MTTVLEAMLLWQPSSLPPARWDNSKDLHKSITKRPDISFCGWAWACTSCLSLRMLSHDRQTGFVSVLGYTVCKTPTRCCQHKAGRSLSAQGLLSFHRAASTAGVSVTWVQHAAFGPGSLALETVPSCWCVCQGSSTLNTVPHGVLAHTKPQRRSTIFFQHF